MNIERATSNAEWENIKKERDNGQTIQAKNIIIFVQLVRLRGC